jgi:hypothetical protein
VVAEADHRVLDQPRGAGDQVRVADRPRRRARQGDVDPVLGQLRHQLAGVEGLGPRLQQRLELLAGAVGGAADGAAFLRWQLGDPAQDAGQLGFAAEVANPQLLQLGTARGGLDRVAGIGPDLFDLLKHRAGPPA